MKSYEELFRCLLDDSSRLCSTNTTRDFLYARERGQKEGDSFYTITLGNFADDFERSLELGYICPSLFRNYRKSGRIPSFLQGIVRQVFDPISGTLLSNPSIEAIRCLRQCCRFAKKVLVEPSPHKTKACYTKFVKNENYVREFKVDKAFSTLFADVSRVLWTRLENFTPGNPRNGPGAVAEKLLPNQKWTFDYWYSRIESVFPMAENVIPDYSYHEELPTRSYSAREEIPVRVISVPKTQKGPRIIAIEPQIMQFLQQSVARPLMDILEYQHPLTRGRIGFYDQKPNGTLARLSSHDGNYATLDLSDASDLVSAKIVTIMLRTCPTFRRYVFACRSIRADVPGYGVMPLSKFASMGSALCFPIEAMVFYTVVLCGLIMAGKTSIVDIAMNRSPRCLVYGDDIIVPVDSTSYVIHALTLAGLRVSTNKSFWTGKFRESCGVDAYDGQDVTPVYLRRLPPKTQADIRAIVSSVTLANALHERGFIKSSYCVKQWVDLVTDIPSERQLCPRYLSFNFGNNPFPRKSRRNEDLQRKEYLLYGFKVERQHDPLQDRDAYLRALCIGGFVNRLTSVRSGDLAVKRQWVSPH